MTDQIRSRVRRHLLQALATGMALGAATASAQTTPLPVVDPLPPPMGQSASHPEDPGCPQPPYPVVDPPPPPFRTVEPPATPPYGKPGLPAEDQGKSGGNHDQ